jgi:ketosteroid isomerase-like protein
MKRQNSEAKLDATHTTAGLAAFFASYFTAKSTKDLDAMMTHFSPDVATYSDAVMGWAVDGYDAIRRGYAMRNEQPEHGLSYPTLILGSLNHGDGSALVAFTNTPEIVGGELHILASIDIRDSTIVRQVDYWDSTDFPDPLYTEQRTAAEQFPREYKETQVGICADPIIIEIATHLHTAIAAGDAAAAASVFDYDAILEDRSLRIQVIGRSAIQRFFETTLSHHPLGVESRLRHIVGGVAGGGFEWHAAPQFGAADGITALTLDTDADITHAAIVYDSRQLDPRDRTSLIRAATQPQARQSH